MDERIFQQHDGGGVPSADRQPLLLPVQPHADLSDRDAFVRQHDRLEHRFRRDNSIDDLRPELGRNVGGHNACRLHPDQRRNLRDPAAPPREPHGRVFSAHGGLKLCGVAAFRRGVSLRADGAIILGGAAAFSALSATSLVASGEIKLGGGAVLDAPRKGWPASLAVLTRPSEVLHVLG